MRPAAIALLVASSAGCNSAPLRTEALGPYVGGGDWSTSECRRSQEQCVARLASEAVGGTTRDFALLDQHGYRVRLSDFCGRTVLLSVGAMDDADSADWMSRIPEILEGVDENVDLTILTTWNRNEDGDVPEPEDVRAWSRTLAERFPELEATVWPPAELPDEPIAGHLGLPVLLDPPRFENAAAAAAASWAASNVPEPLLRFRLEREVAGRYGIREYPHFAVLHPGSLDLDVAPLRIVAVGTDLDADGLITAAQRNPFEDLTPTCE